MGSPVPGSSWNFVSALRVLGGSAVGVDSADGCSFTSPFQVRRLSSYEKSYSSQAERFYLRTIETRVGEERGTTRTPRGLDGDLACDCWIPTQVSLQDGCFMSSRQEARCSIRTTAAIGAISVCPARNYNARGLVCMHRR
jgi:hypothetical protein